MNSVLLVLNNPTPEGQRAAWNALLSQLRNIVWSETEGQLLGELSLVIPLENGRSILERAVSAAETAGFAHRTLYFDQQSGWVRPS